MSNIIFMARLTDPGDFVAVRRAEKLLADHGFSVGHMQRDEPRGILFGDYDIQKWRNLSINERKALHGLMSGSRDTQVRFEIYNDAPLDAVTALANALDGTDHTVMILRP